MQFSMLYSGEQILSFKSCLVFYAGDSLILAKHLQKHGKLIISQPVVNIDGQMWYQSKV